MKYPKHPDGTKDKRYTCHLEWCGAFQKLYVVRFCGDFIASRYSEALANNQMTQHQEARFAEMEKV